MIKIISGGQTGVDQAALEAARACGLETGGFAPKGWLTEDGPAPWLADYGLVEHPSASYPPRTHANVQAADATLLLVFGMIGYGSRGSRLVMRLAIQIGRPLTVIDAERLRPGDAAALLPSGIGVLNVAGNRGSFFSGLHERALSFLTETFRRLHTPEEARP